MAASGSGRVKTRRRERIGRTDGPCSSALSHPDRHDQGLHAKHGDHPLQIVGEDAEAHFGAHLLEPLGQEMCVPHP